MKLGLVTYNLARDWDLPTLIDNCEKTGFTAVELRTTHAHGVEPELDAAGRKRVRATFAGRGVRLLSLGTVCEFHSPDAGEMRRNIARCGEFVRLAHDVGAAGVKVRPNGFPEGVSREQTLAQIGHALRECGEQAAPLDVRVWLEVHGRETCALPYIRAIMDHADHPNVGVCWNSNQADKDASGSIRDNFRLVADRIGNVHIVDLYRRDYPFRQLFTLLQDADYAGYCLAELPYTSPDAVTLMHYYRALFEELCRP